MSILRPLPLVLALMIAAGCTPRAKPLGPEHPANPDAEPGRLADPASALSPAAPMPEHKHP